VSIKLIVEAIEQARINNTNLSTSVEAKINGLIGNVFETKDRFDQAATDLVTALEDVKQFLRAEFGERDNDFIRLIEGAA